MISKKLSIHTQTRAMDMALSADTYAAFPDAKLLTDVDDITYRRAEVSVLQAVVTVTSAMYLSTYKLRCLE